MPLLTVRLSSACLLPVQQQQHPLLLLLLLLLRRLMVLLQPSSRTKKVSIREAAAAGCSETGRGAGGSAGHASPSRACALFRPPVLCIAAPPLLTNDAVDAYDDEFLTPMQKKSELHGWAWQGWARQG